MRAIKVNKVEDILNLGYGTGKVEIESDAIMRYMHSNKNCVNSQINLEELRNVYAKSVKKSYAKKKYMANVQLSSKDIKRVCRIEE